MKASQEGRLISLRLKPGQDVRMELEALAKAESLSAASIIAAVGSLKRVALRYADQKNATIFEGPHEIVSLSGLFNRDGLHAHMSVADTKGQVRGGHLVEGNIVYTTLELTILENPSLEFRRTQDPATGYKELEVIKRSQ